MKSYLPVAVLALIFIFSSQIHAQNNPYPNELKGFELYGRGKIAGLNLAVSSKEDVAKIFGDDCREKCLFDEKWSIKFDYFGNFKRWTGGPLNMSEVVPKPAYVDKIYSITFIPNHQTPINVMDIPFDFLPGGAGASTSHSETVSFYFKYTDKYGLTYSVFDRTVLKSDMEKTVEIDRPKKGDLMEIRYKLPDKEEKQMWAEK